MKSKGVGSFYIEVEGPKGQSVSAVMHRVTRSEARAQARLMTRWNPGAWRVKYVQQLEN